MEVDNKNIFGSRAQTYFQGGASLELLELVRRQEGHKGVKALIHSANVSKVPQSPAPQQHSFEDRFEHSQPGNEHMSFAKMAALVAGSRQMS